MMQRKRNIATAVGLVLAFVVLALVYGCENQQWRRAQKAHQEYTVKDVVPTHVFPSTTATTMPTYPKDIKYETETDSIQFSISSDEDLVQLTECYPDDSATRAFC